MIGHASHCFKLVRLPMSLSHARSILTDMKVGQTPPISNPFWHCSSDSVMKTHQLYFAYEYEHKHT